MAELSCDALNNSSQTASCDESDNEDGNYYGDLEDDNYEPLRRLLEDLERVGCATHTHRLGSSEEAGLHVGNVGRVTSLPLAPNMHARLQQQAQPEAQKAPSANLPRRWHVQPSLLRATNPTWDDLMLKLAVTTSKKMGLLDTSHVQAYLQKVVLIDNANQYEFNLESTADPAPYVFGTMVVLPQAPKQTAKLDILSGEHAGGYRFQGSDEHQLGCLTFFSDEEYELCPNDNGCCLAFVYQLAQSTGEPLKFKVEDWFAEQLRLMMDDPNVSNERRWYYMLNAKYTASDVGNVSQLKQRHQRMAAILQQADKERLLDVQMALVTGEWEFEAVKDAFGITNVKRHPIYPYKRIDHWRTLSGQEIVPTQISNHEDFDCDTFLQEKLSCSFCGVAAHQPLEPDMSARGRCSIQSVEDNANQGQST